MYKLNREKIYINGFEEYITSKILTVTIAGYKKPR